MSHFYQPDDETWEGRMDSYIEEAEKQITTLRAALDQERADNAKLRAFAQEVDELRTLDMMRAGWLTVPMVANGLLDASENPTALLTRKGSKSPVTAFLQSQNDELRAKVRVLRDYAHFCATTCFEFTDQYKYARNLGLLDADGNPTALLSGRGEVKS